MTSTTIYKIISDGKDWQSLCQSLIDFQKLTIRSSVYAYVFTNPPLTTAVRQLVLDLRIDDNVHLVEAIADIPAGARELPSDLGQ